MEPSSNDKQSPLIDATYVVVSTPKGTPKALPPPPATTPASSTASHSSSKASAHGNANSSANPVSLQALFSFADHKDWMFMFVGTLAGITAGLCKPMQVLLIGDTLNAFNPTQPKTSREIMDSINTIALRFVGLAAVWFTASMVSAACWSITGSRQSKTIRAAYVNAILAQEIGWFDLNEPMQLASRVTDSTATIQEGIGRKVSDAINFVSVGLGSAVIALSKGWELALILLAFAPFMILSSICSTRAIAKAVQNSIKSYGDAGAIAQEALSNIRTVQMFSAMDHFVDKYSSALAKSVVAGINQGLALGAGVGLIFFAQYCMYAVGVYFGVVMVSNDQLGDTKCYGGPNCYDGGKVMQVFFCIVTGTSAAGHAVPGIQALYAARVAASEILQVIKRASKINPQSQEGKFPAKVLGRIDLTGVTFAYPSRPDTPVCSDYSLHIQPGETIALVGASGSGKSTVVALLERFYDPCEGSVKLDDVDLRDLNVSWLRQQIGFVGQEPALFATSILENIRNGLETASDEQVVDAAKKANAFDFIMAFPDGFHTKVGERGVQLSGGQKQRIAIARAILKNPPILLLDEATSALDAESEQIVQKSLDALVALSSKRTTLIVAHRLTTVRNATRIAVHKHGRIVELGSHEELIAKSDGEYRALVEAPDRTHEDDEELDQDLIDAHAGRSSMCSVRRSRASTLGRKDLPLGDVTTTNNAVVDVSAMKPVSLMRIWRLSLPEWKFVILGAIGCIINAASFPAWGLMSIKMLVLFVDYSKTKDEMRTRAVYWSIAFVGLAVLYGVSSVMSKYGFAVVSQRLTCRLRVMTFRAMLVQEVAWFDKESNNSGALVARLATDTALLQTMTSDFLNEKMFKVIALTIALFSSFYYSWQMTLATIGILPVLMFAMVVRGKLMAGGKSKETNDADAQAASLLAESIESVRTVASYSLEQRINIKYASLLACSSKTDIRVGLVGGVGIGISQGVQALMMAFLFWLGGELVRHGHTNMESVFMVVFVILCSAAGMGMASQQNDPAKAKAAASNIFGIIDRVPAINPTGGDKPAQVKGEIELCNVSFAYPSRPEAQVYANYSLRIPRGKTVALVGASGSGKSTAIALMERFYDPCQGSVRLDGKDLRTLDLTWLREHMALVSQEPVLFSGSIAENIAMSKPQATREEIIKAATLANAHGFIQSFPNGYDTQVGDRGAQLSGGQKQRIAIARAILRDPEVLLLDEATSALDNESERLVQESLDQLVNGSSRRRTTVIVAHRLSTIRNADLIAVVQNGAIVEQGTHHELMTKSANENSVYKAMVSSQLQQQQV